MAVEAWVVCHVAGWTVVAWGMIVDGHCVFWVVVDTVFSLERDVLVNVERLSQNFVCCEGVWAEIDALTVDSWALE